MKSILPRYAYEMGARGCGDTSSFRRLSTKSVSSSGFFVASALLLSAEGAPAVGAAAPDDGAVDGGRVTAGDFPVFSIRLAMPTSLSVASSGTCRKVTGNRKG